MPQQPNIRRNRSLRTQTRAIASFWQFGDASLTFPVRAPITNRTGVRCCRRSGSFLSCRGQGCGQQLARRKTPSETRTWRLEMTRFSLLLAALAVSAAASASGPAFAADPTGIWLSQDGDVKMKVARCGEAVCSTISWLKEPERQERQTEDRPEQPRHQQAQPADHWFAGYPADEG